MIEKKEIGRLARWRDRPRGLAARAAAMAWLYSLRSTVQPPGEGRRRRWATGGRPPRPPAARLVRAPPCRLPVSSRAALALLLLLLLAPRHLGCSDSCQLRRLLAEGLLLGPPGAEGGERRRAHDARCRAACCVLLVAVGRCSQWHAALTCCCMHRGACCCRPARRLTCAEARCCRDRS